MLTCSPATSLRPAWVLVLFLKEFSRIIYNSRINTKRCKELFSRTSRARACLLWCNGAGLIPAAPPLCMRVELRSDCISSLLTGAHCESMHRVLFHHCPHPRCPYCPSQGSLSLAPQALSLPLASLQKRLINSRQLHALQDGCKMQSTPPSPQREQRKAKQTTSL